LLSPGGDRQADLAKGAGSGWVDYKRPNPTTEKAELKLSYIKEPGDVIAGVGICKSL
jgi:cytochrome c